LEILPYVDALEVFNARCLAGSINRKGREFAESRNLPMMAGSDAHSLVELGLATLSLPEFNSPDELREALKTAVITGRLLSPLDHFKASTMIGLGRLNPRKKK
jgi:predicted metal-dependent phosphoesterase TrpH